MNCIVESQTTGFKSISLKFIDIPFSDSLSFNMKLDGQFILNYSKDTIQQQFYTNSVKINDLILLDKATVQLYNNANCMSNQVINCIDCPGFVLNVQSNENQAIDSEFNFPINKCQKAYIKILFEIAIKYSPCYKDSTFNFYYKRILGEQENVKFTNPKVNE